MEISGSKRTLGVIVDALQREDVKVIDKYIQPTRYGEHIEIVVAPKDGLYNTEQLEEFRRELVPDLPIKGRLFPKRTSGNAWASLDFWEEVPTVEIGSYKLKGPRGRRDIRIRIYPHEQIARDYKEARHKNIRRLIMARTPLYMLKSYLGRVLDHALHH